MKYDRETLVKKIAEHEGIVLEPYNDSLGISTIGIGRNLEGRGIDDYELMHMNKTLEEIIADGLTEEEAYYLCNNDIDIVSLLKIGRIQCGCLCVVYVCIYMPLVS